MMRRFELPNTIFFNSIPILKISKSYYKEIVGFLNHYYSEISSVNNIYVDLKRLNIIRLYLIKSYKGRCHAIGKPVRGQRTWSNAWSTYNNNYILRRFINEARIKTQKNKLPEKINYKLIKKKYGTKRKKFKKSLTKKKTWI